MITEQVSLAFSLRPQFFVEMEEKNRLILCNEKSDNQPMLVGISTERVAAYCEEFVEYAVL